MSSGFRFLVLCEEIRGFADSASDFANVLEELTLPSGAEFPCVVELEAAVGLFVTESMAGKSLGLVACQEGEKGEWLPLPRRCQAVVVIPTALGPVTCIAPISLWIPRFGTFGFLLYDHERVLGPKSELLATYKFLVSEALDPQRN